MRTGIVKITGISQVVRNLKRADKLLGAQVQRGLVLGGQYLERESKKICPVDEGNLRKSGFTRNMGGSGWLADIVVGYTANYAVYVHEDLTKLHGEAYNNAYRDTPGFKSRGKNQQAKFLEHPARTKRLTILTIIYNAAKGLI